MLVMRGRFYRSYIEQNRSPKMILRRSQVDDHLGGVFFFLFLYKNY